MSIAPRCNRLDAELYRFGLELFDLVVSMFGVMFAPRPAMVVDELRRVTKPGGRIALANWTPEGFIGKMFNVFKAHLPPPPAGLPSARLKITVAEPSPSVASARRTTCCRCSSRRASKPRKPT